MEILPRKPIMPATRNGLTTLLMGAVLLAFSMSAWSQHEDFDGSESCLDCHEEQYQEWSASGHPYKLMKGEQARYRPIPLPEGYTWDDISYVIGGYKWKSRYMDQDGYIITFSGEDKDVPGQNQYNYLTGTWTNYNAGVVDKPYDCGRCHTTGWIADEDAATDGDLSDNQDGKPGIHGIFYTGGVHCEECHGPGANFSTGMQMDASAEACGRCHYRTAAPGADVNVIPASGGFIQHHEQYNEFLASPHADALTCVSCHNPHKRGEFSIKETGQCGVSCHSSKMESFMQTSMFDYGVTCEDCHMPFASKSAVALGEHEGDVQTHIYYINTDPAASMFTEDGAFVALDDDGKASVTLDFACQRCHETATLNELAKFAKDFHNPDKGLEDFGLDAGLSGTWWNSERSGEGFVLEFGKNGQGDLFLFASLYTYDGEGNQVWLVATGTATPGETAMDVSVVMPVDGKWGDALVPDDVNRIPWGTGNFEFPTCTGGTVTLAPNTDMQALGFTDLSYDISRILDPGIACPTFVNNAQ